MKTLNVIQTISKVGRIVSSVLFVCCIVGFCLSAVGLIGLALGGEAFKLGGVTIHSLIEKNAGVNRQTMVASTVVGMVFCMAYGVICRAAVTYFKHELADGTPFTMSGAAELMRLGILTATVSLGAAVLCSIGVAAANHFVQGIGEVSYGEYSCVGVGITLILLSLFCRYGAELNEDKQSAENE